MNKKVEKLLIEEVKSAMAEYDFDYLFSKGKLKVSVEKVLQDEVERKVYYLIEQGIYKAIHKHQPIIDAIIVSKVEQVLGKYETKR